jgi:hypothetical protein
MKLFWKRLPESRQRLLDVDMKVTIMIDESIPEHELGAHIIDRIAKLFIDKYATCEVSEVVRGASGAIQNVKFKIHAERDE